MVVPLPRPFSTSSHLVASCLTPSAADLYESPSINISIDQTLKNICLCLAVPPGPSLVRLFPVHPIGQSVPISSCLSFVHLSEDKCSIAIMLAHHHLAVYLLSFFHLFLPVFPLCRSLSLSNSRSGHPSISAISHNMACLGTGQESEISSHII